MNTKNLTPFEESVRKYKKNNMGSRYEHAELSKINFPGQDQLNIKKFMDNPKNFLIFLGSAGMGKTYFCAAMVEWAFKMFGQAEFRYFHEKDLLYRLRNSIGQSSGDYIEVLKHLIDSKFLIIDDIGSQKKSDWTEEILFDLIDYRYNSRLPTIFTSNLMVNELNSIYHKRISSRLFATENTIVKFENGKDLRSMGY